MVVEEHCDVRCKVEESFQPCLMFTILPHLTMLHATFVS